MPTVMSRRVQMNGLRDKCDRLSRDVKRKPLRQRSERAAVIDDCSHLRWAGVVPSVQRRLAIPICYNAMKSTAEPLAYAEALSCPACAALRRPATAFACTC